MFKADIAAEEAYAEAEARLPQQKKSNTHVFDKVARKEPVLAEIHRLEIPQPEPEVETAPVEAAEAPAVEVIAEVAATESPIETPEPVVAEIVAPEPEIVEPVVVEVAAAEPEMVEAAAPLEPAVIEEIKADVELEIVHPEPQVIETVPEVLEVALPHIIEAAKPEEAPLEVAEPKLSIRFADKKDAETIFGLIQELAEYEQLAKEVVSDVETLRKNLFAPQPYAECLLAEVDGKTAGFALFFHNFSTFQGKPGLYLEDLYVKPEFRKQGIGLELFRKLARLAMERDCMRFEWRVLDWNIQSIIFYNKLGARPLSNWITQRLERAQIEKLAEGN